MEWFSIMIVLCYVQDDLIEIKLYYVIIILSNISPLFSPWIGVYSFRKKIIEQTEY